MDTGKRCLLAVALMASSADALCQGIPAYVEYRKRVEAAQNISPLDDGLFGEQISLYNGNTQFSVTDIEIPGNDSLPVKLSRTFAVEMQPQNTLDSYDSLLRGIGNWDVDVPSLSATYAAASPDSLRCDGPYVPGLVIGAGFRRGDVWQGISINVPGRGKTLALGVESQTPRPSGGATYKLTTSERDVLECIAMKPGYSGQGFRMTTTSGLRYYFDVPASRTAATLVRQIKDVRGFPFPVYMQRSRLYLLASKMEDRFGNIVEYQYNANGNPVRIWSSDGREILLNYTSGRLSTATSQGRTWQYQYSTVGTLNGLSKVILPDSSSWKYTYSDDLMPPPDSANVPPLPWCQGMGPGLGAALTLTATHPSGAVGTFAFTNHRHYRSGVHATECAQTGDSAHPDYDLLVPYYFDVLSIDSKKITGAGLSSSLTWQYAYNPNPQTLWGTHTAPPSYPCTTCAVEKTTTVTRPNGEMTRYHFGMRYYDNDGRQLQVESLDSSGNVLRNQVNVYMTESQAGSQPFFGEYGTNSGSVSDPASIRIRPLVKRTLTQDGTAFTWQANSFDVLARPSSVTKKSAPVP